MAGRSASIASLRGPSVRSLRPTAAVSINAEPSDPSRCPICGRPTLDLSWMEERSQFFVECPGCTTFTITGTLAARFRCALHPDERRHVDRLSRYLHHAGDDDDREVTEDSWQRMAAEAPD